MTLPRRPSSSKVLPLPALLDALRGPRAAGRTVVFTNGVYDLIHAGHLELLERAAAEGDVLVVALNGDASVRRLKGPSRPILPFADRARLLAAFEAVDWVTSFDEDTPAEIVAALVPDVLVKGGDWAVDRIVGREVVEANGGRVVRVPLVQGRSTSSIVDRIRGGEGG